jgi:ATP-dependent exoDNAse (exonuclease V) beta subunit
MSYTVLQYGDNYRSEEELIDYYNTTLSKILNGKSGKLYDIEYGRPLNCKKNEPTENGEVGYIDTDNIYESTARLILHLKYEEGCNFKDITVLLKNYRSEIDNYTNLFAIYNIPFLSSGEDTIGDYIELDSIIKYLGALSNPYDDIKLISLFKTPFFYIDDVTLYDISKVEKNNYFEKSEEYFKDHKKFNSKFSIFRTLLQEVNIKSNEDIIKSIIKRNNYDYYLSLRENKKILMSGVNKIIKIARELTIQNLFTFYELSNYLNSNSDIIPINNDIANDEDVVRIITVHKSKGLEFPIVIYPQMDKGTKNRNRSVFYMEENGIIFKFIKKTKYLDSIKTLINDKEEKEYYRLLYVAFTRAKEKLFLLSKDNKNKEIKDIVKEGYEWNVSLSEIENIEITKEKTTLLPIKKISIIPSEIGMSVSNFLENICFQGDGKKEKKKEVRSELAVIGTIVHNILENDDFEFEKVNFNDLPESVYEKVKNIIEKYKNSSIFNEISSSNGNDFREVEVAGIYNYNGVNYMLHGRIDRLIINKNGNATLIDYKTSISGSGFERDKMQLKIYKKILSNRFKIIDAFLLDLENLRKIRISEQ